MSPLRMLKPFPESKRTMHMAPRLPSLKGKTIGTLWNNKPHGDEFLGLVSERIAERHGAARVIHLERPYPGSVAPPAIMNELVSTCDVVICGVGD